LHAPPGGRLDRAGIAVSPDGRKLAFIAKVKDRRELWIRDIDSAVARRVPDTVGAAVPFWSPDSRSVAYHAEAKLWRVAVAGGSPQQICDASMISYGAWGEDGTILFSETMGGLRRVSAAGGGEFTMFTTPDPARAEASHLAPGFLPGGRFFLCIRSNKAENNGIYVSTLAKPNERVKLISGELGGAFFANGHLVWRRGTTLVAQPFDPATGRLSGEARAVTYPVGGLNRMGSVTFSVSSGVLAYFASDPSSQFTWFDRTGKVLGTLGDSASFAMMFAISPDGSNIVVSAQDRNLWTMEVARKVWTRFTFSDNGDGFPVWSPSGRTVIFRSSPLNLFRKDIGATVEPQRLTTSEFTQWPNDWSRDGRLLLYYEMSKQTRRDLWVLPVNPDGTAASDAKPRVYLKTPFNEYIARFSPEPGPRWVAYQSDETGRLDIYVQAFPEPRAKRRISTDGGSYASWSPDGREIYYLSPDDMLMAVAVTPRDGDLLASAPRELFKVPWDGELTGMPYQISPDGQRFLVRATREGDSPAAEVIVNWQALLKKAEAAQ
jgi:Tol biopolymer transport system component